MAIYHFSTGIIGRSKGLSAVASAAWRSASVLHDDRLDRAHDFSKKGGVIHSEVMLAEGAPARLSDRATLWNAVEAGEKRKDAQLARDVEFAIPREMSERDGVELAREFVAKHFVAHGMIADLNVYWDKAKDGSPKPHARVMLTMRSVGPEGFGNKVILWNSKVILKAWREAWAEHVNTRLAELGFECRVDHRTLEAQGIPLEPQYKIGRAAARRPGQDLHSERTQDHARIARENGARIIDDPSIALKAILQGRARFTYSEMVAFAVRHSDGEEQRYQVLDAVRSQPEFINKCVADSN